MATVLTIPIPEELAARLQSRAQEEGIDVVTLATRSLEREAIRPLLLEVLAPVHQAFAESGMTDDELAEFLEVEKHDMRGVEYGRK